MSNYWLDKMCSSCGSDEGEKKSYAPYPLCSICQSIAVTHRYDNGQYPWICICKDSIKNAQFYGAVMSEDGLAENCRDCGLEVEGTRVK